MPSRPELRRWLERAARVGALALLAWMVVRTLSPREAASAEARADSRSLPAALAEWTLAPSPGAVHVTLAAAPAARERDWLRALARAGVRVRWSGDALPPTALEVVARNDPAGGVRAFIAAPPALHASLSDAIGPIDSVTIASGVNAVALPLAVGAVGASVSGQDTHAAPPDSLLPRQVVVLGRVGWEGKFVMAALEERGWRVSARLRVAPNVYVTQGAPLPLDTSRTGAVIALDSSVGPYAEAIARFERDGGGVVLAGDAPLVRAFRSMAPGGIGARIPAASLTFAADAPRRALGFFPVLALAPDAVALESRGGHVAAAARRVGVGRVVQLGYDESWRWRLAGSGDAMAAHGDFWSAVVSSAAYRAAAPIAAARGDAAPLASLYAALGPPVAPGRASAVGGSGLPWWMFAALAVLLLGEWGSRRLRGAR
jgi:hypothetical protein